MAYDTYLATSRCAVAPCCAAPSGEEMMLSRGHDNGVGNAGVEANAATTAR